MELEIVRGAVSLGPMNELSAAFDELRPYLVRVAYTHTGSVSDAEDIVQEAWLRLSRSDHERIENLKAWLTTAVTRLALDSLTSARARRESYVGEWLPEPVLTAGPDLDDPAETVTLDETVSMALLVLLESLSPSERCSFVLHDVFGFPFEQVAEVVGRSPDAVRQLASRARRHVEAGRPRFPPSHDEHRRVVEAFRRASSAGDIEGLMELLDPQVKVRADGGGVVPTVKPVIGARRAAQVLVQVFGGVRRYPGATISDVSINGAPGLVTRLGEAFTLVAFTVDNGLISEVDIFRNPEKLGHVRL
jgi:RNA polymerase sigma-70 factor, ECF subfamily